ncbi:MAG: hypothetical protein IT170_05135 [Bryobacterales bacterium]|nr:hypothetical protein [Bryobacterales bacterium]
MKAFVEKPSGGEDAFNTAGMNPKSTVIATWSKRSTVSGNRMLGILGLVAD